MRLRTREVAARFLRNFYRFFPRQGCSVSLVFCSTTFCDSSSLSVSRRSSFSTSLFQDPMMICCCCCNFSRAGPPDCRCRNKEKLLFQFTWPDWVSFHRCRDNQPALGCQPYCPQDGQRLEDARILELELPERCTEACHLRAVHRPRLWPCSRSHPPPCCWPAYDDLTTFSKFLINSSCSSSSSFWSTTPDSAASSGAFARHVTGVGGLKN
uniref:(northern house mosquito) hypothetical protein n=1 Tax=Culex pipiens TaxID=7175 RepID=A0A8D8HS35_CULPI